MRSPKLQLAGIPEALHTRLLAGIGTSSNDASTNVAGIRVELAMDSASTVGAPELCSGCTITLLHHVTDALTSPLVHEIEVYNDTTAQLLCSLSLATYTNEKTEILADTCGTVATEGFGTLAPQSHK
jgi:hypothetical protein